MRNLNKSILASNMTYMLLDDKLFKKMMFFLVYSNNYEIRERIAEIGYRLDVLVNDPNWGVREQVAKHGYRLDILINDPSPIIRHEVAKQGYGLDTLINDSNINVRDTAKEKKIR